MKNNNWVRGAMLLAVGLVLQALRLVIPMPPFWRPWELISGRRRGIRRCPLRTAVLTW